MECSGRFFYLDGKVRQAGSSGDPVTGDIAFYEVIRTRNGIPLFFEDHMNRLREGIITKYDLQGDIAAEVRNGMNALISKDLHEEINVRVTVTFRGQEHSLHICYIPSSYPSVNMISEGVPLILYHAERPDPGVKVVNNKLRLPVNEELKRREAYEALLVDHEGYITEGSRSNIFFIRGDGVIQTAPDSMVLSGITRRYVTEIIRREGISLRYEAVRVSEIGGYRSAFLTGTSPMVLAVRSVEGQVFDVSDPVIRRFREIYAGLAERSISDYRNKNKAK